MSKVICEICGTVYPDNATVCPICGYPRSEDEQLNLLDEEMPQSTPRHSQPVKGGRFSNKNVKKRKSQAMAATPAPRTPAEEDSGRKAPKKRKKNNSNRGLVITVIVLLVAVLLVGAYIAMRFFVGQSAYHDSTVPSGTIDPASLTSEPVPEDTGVPCTDLYIGDIDPDKGVEFNGTGRAWRVNVITVPANTTDSVTYTCADESVAAVSVNQDRVEILSVGPGSTTVTITCGTVSKTFPIVCAFETEPTGDGRQEGVLALDREDMTFAAEDETYTLDPGMGIAPEDVTWSSDDESVATVDETGTVTAVGAGTCNITAARDGEKVVCIVRCNIEPAPIEDAGPPYTLSHTDVTIRVGESFDLLLKDKNGDVVDVKWVGDEDVKIDGNTITGAGSGRVNVKCTHNGEEFVCIVRVG